MPKKRILVAAVKSGQERAKRVLEPEFHVETADTIREAEQKLSATDGHLAALVVGMHFDESRGLDLVTFVCKDERWDRLPIIALQELPFKTADLAAKAADWSRRLGVSIYVNAAESSNGDDELKAAVHKHLENPGRPPRRRSPKDNL